MATAAISKAERVSERHCSYKRLHCQRKNNSAPAPDSAAAEPSACAQNHLEMKLGIFIKELVTKHYCVRRNRRYARQIHNLRVSIFPRHVRSCSLECAQQGKRTYLGRPEGREADAGAGGVEGLEGTTTRRKKARLNSNINNNKAIAACTLWNVHPRI